MTLDEVLSALLFRRSFRRRFANGERSSLGIEPAAEESLASVDIEELDRCARSACRAVLERSQRGVGSLLDAFPRTIEAWYAAHAGADLDDLAAAFAESEPFGEWRPAGAADPLAPPLEDVFRRFCERDLGAEFVTTVRAECVFALLRALVVNPSPAFAVPEFIRPAPKGFYSVIDRQKGPFLVAALEGRFVTGDITPFLGALLRGGDDARLVGAAPRDRERSMLALQRLGLVT